MTSTTKSGTSSRLNSRWLACIVIVAGLLALAASIFGGVKVAAQDAPFGLDRWAVEVWPEYDQPAVLVLLNGTVAGSASLPVDVRIPVPAGVDINAVAFPGEDGRLISIPWQSEPTVEGQDIVFTLDQSDFIVEYYADVISPPPSRSFDLNLAAPYPVQQASVTLRAPARASDLQTTPAMQSTGTDALGNPLYALQLGALAAGQPLPFSVSYTKSDANPTIVNAVVGDDVAGATAADSTGIDWLPLLAGLVLALVVVAGVAFWWWRRRQAAGGSRQARRRAAREKGEATRPASAPAPQKPAKTLYCTQCGAKFEAADQFCRGCGAKRQ